MKCCGYHKEVSQCYAEGTVWIERLAARKGPLWKSLIQTFWETVPNFPLCFTSLCTVLVRHVTRNVSYKLQIIFSEWWWNMRVGSWQVEEGAGHEKLEVDEWYHPLILHALFCTAFVWPGKGTRCSPARIGLLNWRTFYTAKKETLIMCYS